jgi:anti-anti-sigma factor
MISLTRLKPAPPTPDDAAASSTGLLDMAFVTYIDSAGLGALIEVYNRIQRSGGALRFANLQPRTATAL